MDRIKKTNFRSMLLAVALLILVASVFAQVPEQTTNQTPDETVTISPFNALLSDFNSTTDVSLALQGNDDLFAVIQTTEANPDVTLLTNFESKIDENITLKNATLKFSWVKENAQALARAIPRRVREQNIQVILLGLMLVVAVLFVAFFFRSGKKDTRKTKLSILSIWSLFLIVLLFMTGLVFAQLSYDPISTVADLADATAADLSGSRTITSDILEVDERTVILQPTSSAPATIVLGFQKVLPEYAAVHTITLKVNWLQQTIPTVTTPVDPTPIETETQPDPDPIPTETVDVNESTEDLPTPDTNTDATVPSDTNTETPTPVVPTTDSNTDTVPEESDSEDTNTVLVVETQAPESTRPQVILFQTEDDANSLVLDATTTADVNTTVDSNTTNVVSNVLDSNQEVSNPSDTNTQLDVNTEVLDDVPIASSDTNTADTVSPAEDTNQQIPDANTTVEPDTLIPVIPISTGEQITASVQYWENQKWYPLAHCQDIPLPSDSQFFECDLSFLAHLLTAAQELKLAFVFSSPTNTQQVVVDSAELLFDYSIELPGKSQASFFLADGDVPIDACQALDAPDQLTEQSCNITPYITSLEQLKNLHFKTNIQNIQGKTTTKFDSIKLELTYDTTGTGTIEAVKLDDSELEEIRKQVRLRLQDLNISGLQSVNDDNTVDILFDVDGTLIRKILIDDLNLDIGTYELLIQDLNASEINTPEDTEWDEVIVVDPSGLAFEKAYIEGQTEAEELWKCVEFDEDTHECLGEWVKIQNIAQDGNFILEVTAADPLFGFGRRSTKLQSTHQFNCRTCKKHLVPANTEIQVTATAIRVSQTSATFAEQLPTDWTITDAAGGTVSAINSEQQSITWTNITPDRDDQVSITYSVRSPKVKQRQTAEFVSRFGNKTSTPWTTFILPKSQIGKELGRRSLKDIRQSIKSQIKDLRKKKSFDIDEALILPFDVKNETFQDLRTEFYNSEEYQKRIQSFASKRFGNKQVHVGLEGDDLFKPTLEIIESDEDPENFAIVAKSETNEFRPGAYTAVVLVEEGNTAKRHEYTFYWGLVTINSQKPLYHPGEEAELYVVVLDAGGFPTSGALVTINVDQPDGSALSFSTQTGTVAEISKGIYRAAFTVQEIGNYIAQAFTDVEGQLITGENNFSVKEFFEFDIEREMPYTIDPRLGPFHTKITVTPLVEGNPSYFVREVVSLSTTISNTTASLSTTDTLQYLDWAQVQGKQTFEYDFDVPWFWPRLFEFGPVEIAYNEDQTFTEERAWDLAIDPLGTTNWFIIPTTIAGYDINEPKPNRHTDFPVLTTHTAAAAALKLDTAGASATTKSNSFSFGEAYNKSGDANLIYATSLPLRAQSITAGTWTTTWYGLEGHIAINIHPGVYVTIWTDANDSPRGHICDRTANGTELPVHTYLMPNTVTCSGVAMDIAAKDKLVFQGFHHDNGLKYGTWSVSGTIYYGGATYPSKIVSPQALHLFNQIDQPVIDIPTADANSTMNAGDDFLVEGTVTCSSMYLGDCGDVNTFIQFCTDADCSDFANMTTSSSGLKITSGDNPQYFTDANTGETSATLSWVVNAETADTYELRLSSDGNFTDVNASSGTDRTITVGAGATDLTFALALPGSGCTANKGRTSSGDGACEKTYFEATDLTGTADQNEVNPEGQDASTSFFTYDNQSTTSDDFNFTLDLNAALPNTLFVKASTSSSGYAATCSGDPDADCVSISATAQNIGKAIFTAGTLDLNIWLWADFQAAAGNLKVDRNATSTSIES